MALSSLGGALSTGLNSLQRSSEGIVQPLTAIEDRRMKRQAAADEAKKAEAAKMKAQAQKQAADEAQRTGEAKRLQDAQNQSVLQGMPPITVENMNNPQFTQQLRGQVKHLMNSGNAEAITHATGIMKQVESFSKTGAIDEPTTDPATGQRAGGTMQGEQAGVRMNEQTSQTELNRSMSRVPVEKASAMDAQWAAAHVNETDPGKQGIKSAWTPNMSMAAQQRQAAILTDIISQVRDEYAAQNGGAQMPSELAYDRALGRFNTMKANEGAGSTYTGQPTKPVPATAAPGQPKARYNWSN
jgi:hypothetical protein